MATKNTTKTPKTAWVNVNDQQPPMRENILICTNDGVVGEGSYRGGTTFILHRDHRLLIGSVTHWLPIPEAPKEATK